MEGEGVISGYWKKVEGRGRPRRMYQIDSQWQERSEELSQLWHDYILQQSGTTGSTGPSNSAPTPMAMSR